MRVTMDNSGVNFTGPRQTFGGVEVQVGTSWPAPYTVHAMFHGLWEDALPHKEAIDEFLAAQGLPPCRANNGESITGTYGFVTRQCRDDREQKYAEEGARREARILREYREQSFDCPRRERLERVAATGVADGFLVKPQVVALFLSLIEE